MTKINKIVYFILAIIFFTFFDFYFSNLLINSRFSIADNDLFSIIFVQNTGAAFSLLENNPLLLILFASVAIMLIVVYGIKHAEKFSVFACFWAALLISGIGCNLYERIFYGYVRDFFKINIINFPVFNISDIFINIGVIALIIIIIKNKYLKK
jgi:signal peptidase II